MMDLLKLPRLPARRHRDQGGQAQKVGAAEGGSLVRKTLNLSGDDILIPYSSVTKEGREEILPASWSRSWSRGDGDRYHC